MKLYYIVNARIPTEKAHGVQIMKVCEAFAEAGLDIELVVPNRINHLEDDPFDFYNVKRSFKINKLFTVDLIKFGRIGFLIENSLFSFSAFIYLFLKTDSIFYTRDEISAFFLSLISKKVFWEAHEGRFNFLVKKNIKRNGGIIVISDNLKKFLVEKGADERKIFVARDGVDLKQFIIKESSEECRLKLNLPQDKKIVLYTGHLYKWKGVDILAEAAQYLDNNFLVLFVGGLEQDIKRFKEKYSVNNNINFIGWKTYDLMPYYMKAADVLVLPNSAEEEISRLYTSPMKLFEYMASGRPIVASDLPSIREILNERNAVLVESDQPSKLASGIKKVIEDPNLAMKISQQALSDVAQYSWKNRAENILHSIQDRI
ncbi:MAG: D-inositol 3-phosphate glycosyltransferase [Parcubacteria group bacterium ADurb.Bin316]|nr:MAG: D-inositol 3-phosphate glycosyltransferase [Parcubacteria group bacterium ADurb.Bin316]